MITSQKGISLIKQFEELRLEAYLSATGIWTIGYGYTKGVKSTMKITEEEAKRLLNQTLFKIEQDIHKIVHVPLNQYQFDALVSFAFNCGITALSTSTLLQHLNRGEYTSAAKEFFSKIYLRGQPLKRLERRCVLEKRLFETEEENSNTLKSPVCKIKKSKSISLQQ